MSIKIPQDGKFSQPNNSDLFGNLWYTRNMNFDEEGYIKLSSRSVSVKSEEDDSAFNLPISFGRSGTEFHVVTTDAPFDLSITETNFSITEDSNTGNPSLTADSWGKWFENKWHATTDTGLRHTTGGAWTTTGVTLTSGKVHAIEVFRNKNSLAVSNGNSIKLLDNSYATTVTLTIPADFEIVNMAYSNAKMGIVTMMSDTAAGQNQEAYFFIWDGASASVGQGWGMGSDTILAIAAYKSSWVILTRTGELKYFNGGGFEDLAKLPFYFQNTTLGDSQNRLTFGDVMTVEGDLIYLNIGNDLDAFGRNGESYLQNYPAGILCFDPNVGLYHRYSPSISPVNQITVTDANIDTTNNILTSTGGTLYSTGNPIKYVHTSATPIGGLVVGTVYYIIKHTATTFSLAATKADAHALNKIDITSVGASSNYFMALNLLDYGSSKAHRTGGMGFMEIRRELSDHIVFGSEIPDYNSTTDFDTLCMTSPRFENRGYFVTAKIVSTEIEDNIKKVFIKHRPLDDQDKLIVKYKDKDILGIPTSTPQFSTATTCTWVDANTFTTTADLSAIEDYLSEDSANECEVEVLSGAGGGQMAQISSISEDSGTYTISLNEDLDGVAEGYRSDIFIDNWKLLKTTDGESVITSNNTLGYQELPVATNSKWIKFKVEFRGVETTVEDFQIVSETQVESA